MHLRFAWFLAGVGLFGIVWIVPAAETSPAELFEQRIVPIFKSPNPSSCVQCHLAGVDLKDYILPSSEKTFLSLRDQGLVDLDKPEKSKILKLINAKFDSPVDIPDRLKWQSQGGRRGFISRLSKSAPLG